MSCIKEMDADDCVVLPKAVHKRSTMLDTDAPTKKKTKPDVPARDVECVVLFRHRNGFAQACATCGRDPPRHTGWKIVHMFDNIDKAKHEAKLLNWAFGRDYDVAIMTESDWCWDVLEDTNSSKHIDYTTL